MSPLSVPLVLMLICIIINRVRQSIQAQTVILILLHLPTSTVIFAFALLHFHAV